MSKRVRGIYEKEPGSGIWWIRYADESGRIRREKVGNRGAAIKLYQKRKTEVLQGKKLPENLRSVVHVNDLAPALKRDYVVNRRKSTDALERRLEKHVLPFFGSISANDLETADINRYVDNRRDEGAENGTINRELAVLKRMFTLARKSKPPLVREVPAFPRLKESAPRSGFVEERQFRSLVAVADTTWLRAILVVAYTYGFRRSELLKLKANQVDLLSRSIRLNSGSTKNDQARMVTMTQEVFALMSECVRGKSPEQCVFTRESQEPVINFRGTWYALCAKAGLGAFEKNEEGKEQWVGLVFHDLRRSAVRNMVRRGVPERVAMMISGHKTRSVFDRYNIVSESDIEEAAAKIERGGRMALEAATDTKTDTGEIPPPPAGVRQEVNISIPQ